MNAPLQQSTNADPLQSPASPSCPPLVGPEQRIKPLHDINPLRLNWIHQNIGLTGKTVIDIGCWRRHSFRIHGRRKVHTSPALISQTKPWGLPGCIYWKAGKKWITVTLPPKRWPSTRAPLMPSPASKCSNTCQTPRSVASLRRTGQAGGDGSSTLTVTPRLICWPLSAPNTYLTCCPKAHMTTPSSSSSRPN